MTTRRTRESVIGASRVWAIHALTALENIESQNPSEQMKRRRTSRRRVFWAWPNHIREGRILYLDPRKISNGMVRVRVTVLGKI